MIALAELALLLHPALQRMSLVGFLVAFSGRSVAVPISVAMSCGSVPVASSVWTSVAFSTSAFSLHSMRAVGGVCTLVLGLRSWSSFTLSRRLDVCHFRHPDLDQVMEKGKKEDRM